MSKQRELVTKEELGDILTSQLQNVDNCKGCSIKIRYLLKEPDSEGCNWSTDMNVVAGPDINGNDLAPHIDHLIREARAKYNIKE